MTTNKRQLPHGHRNNKMYFHAGCLVVLCLFGISSVPCNAAISEPSCQDSLPECKEFFQDRTRCRHHRHFASKYCTKACDLCPTLAPNVGACTDSLSDCRTFLKSFGDCAAGGGIFDKYCPQTCGKCECQDVLPNCDIFVKNKNLCDKGELFHQYCARTCGVCGIPSVKPNEVCVDELKDCGTFLRDAEDCKANMRFFSKYCAKTCDLCGQRLGYQSHTEGLNGEGSTVKPLAKATMGTTPRPSRTLAPTAATECKDLLRECRAVVKKQPDYCQHHVTYMRTHCAKSCNYCQGSGAAASDKTTPAVEHPRENILEVHHKKCRDNRPECADYARNPDYCSYEREFMEENCPRACGFCKKVFHFSISTLWDGTPIQHEPVQISLGAQDAGHVRLDVMAPLFDDPGPPPCGAGACNGLWDYEVAEVFFLGEGEKYLEVEVGPHGQHLVLLLNGVRQPFKMMLPLNYTAKKDQAPKRWNGAAVIPLSYFPPSVRKINAYAIHGSGTQRQYQSLYPAKGTSTPDFHRLEFFQEFDFKEMFPAMWSQPRSPYYN